jgi:hypothetical protein
VDIKLATTGIILLLLIVGFSGCTDQKSFETINDGNDSMYNERGCRGKGFEPSSLLFIS